MQQKEGREKTKKRKNEMTKKKEYLKEKKTNSGSK